MNKKKKRVKGLVAIMLAFTMMSVMQLTAFAAVTSSKTVTSLTEMVIVLDPGKTGNSSTITFNFGALPSNAMITEITVDASHASRIGGLGVILAQSATITSPSGVAKKIAWGSGNVTTTEAFMNTSARGTWSVFMSGTNIASATSGSQYYAATKYSMVKMTIEYTS